MLSVDRFWITVAEVKGFAKMADEVFTHDERELLTNFLAAHPLAGEDIPDSGGLRLVRWPAASQGAGGNVRVVYFFRDLNVPVYVLALYRRGERMDLTTKNKRVMRDLVEEIIEAYGRRWAIEYPASTFGAA